MVMLRSVQWGVGWVGGGGGEGEGGIRKVTHLIYDKDLSPAPTLRGIRAMGHLGQLP